MTRALFPLLILFAGLALLLPQSLTAQNDEAAKDDLAEQAPADYRGPLPFYFGKLGIGDEQKKKLYAIDDDYAAKIEAVERQIQKLKDERDAKMEMLLTPGQKLRLKELREEAAKKNAQEPKEASEQKKPAA